MPTLMLDDTLDQEMQFQAPPPGSAGVGSLRPVVAGRPVVGDLIGCLVVESAPADLGWAEEPSADIVQTEATEAQHPRTQSARPRPMRESTAILGSAVGARGGARRVDDIHDLDAEDVQNFQRGIDREGCFNRLTKRHEKAVERFVARQGRSPSGPADITQKVFLHAYQKLDGLRTAGAIRKWLYAIAYREWIADCAKGNHDPLVHSNGDLAIGTASAASRTPEESSIVEEELEAVSDAIDSLPRQERLCFCLVCVEQHSYREAADLLHLSIGTVKAHVDHARTKLQRILGPDWRDYLP